MCVRFGEGGWERERRGRGGMERDRERERGEETCTGTSCFNFATIPWFDETVFKQKPSIDKQTLAKWNGEERKGEERIFNSATLLVFVNTEP